jgi:TRAP-type transport system periplasmic protein
MPALGGSLARSAAAAESYTMRMSLTDPAASLVGAVGLRLAAAVNRRSDGQLKIEVYPSYQLVPEQQVATALTTGVIDLAIQSSPQVEPLLPALQVFDMPFLLKDDAAAYRVLDGPIGTQFFAELEPKGIVGLAWGTGGFKELATTTRAVSLPEDMKGLRVRVQSGAVFTATFAALGAIPVTIDSSESYIALQQHTVDGLDGNLDSLTTRKMYVVTKHVAMSNHVLSLIPLLGSARKIQALPPPLQRILKEESKSLVPFWRTLHARQTAEDIEILKKNGVTFTEIQYAAFRKAVDPVYVSVQTKIGSELIERIGRAANAG